MKRKIVYAFLISLVMIFTVSGSVKAVFDADTAEDKVSNNNFYVELVSADGKQTIEDAKELNEGFGYEVIYKSVIDLPQEFYVHYYLEANGIGSADPTVDVSQYGVGTSLTPSSEKFKVDKTGRDAVEGWVKVKLTGQITKADTSGIKIIIKSDLWIDRTLKVSLAKSTRMDEIAESERAKAELEKMENAWQTIPADNADAQSIQTFISSDMTHNDSKNLYTISQETAEKWKATLEEWRNKNPEMKGTINPTIWTLDNYISYKKGAGTEEDIYAYKDTIVDNFTKSEDATKEYIKSLITSNVSGGRDILPDFNDVLDDIGSYKPTDLDADTTDKVEGITSTILTMVTDVGMVLAVLILGILGIKYMLGSVESRAEYKKDLIPYLIGAGLLFGVLIFVKALMLWGQEISNI